MKLLGEAKKRILIGDIWYFGITGLFLLVMFFFGPGLEKNSREIIICIVIVVGLFGLLGLKIWTNIEFHQFAFIFIIIVGSLSLMIQPILNTPDETAHFARAEWVSRGNIIVDSSHTEYETIQSVIDLHENVKRPYISSTIKAEEIDYSITKVGHIAASNASFLYFPQAIGVFVAKLLKLDVIWMLWLARLGNLLCYAIGVSFALKIAPKLRFVLFFVSALPICIQQAASCSPDAIINMSAFLLIAYFLYLYCLPERTIEWKQIIMFWGISVIVTISKVTNIFIAGLILIIPLNRFLNRKRAFCFKCLTIGSIITIGSLYYLHTSSFPVPLDHVTYFREANVNSAEQIQYIISNFMTWIQGFGTSLINNSESYVNSLGSFGWLEYGNSLIPIMILFLFGRICVQESGLNINRINKVLIFLMIVGIYCVTCLALYITWTPVGSEVVLGVQGRYFIPMLALLSLLLVSPKSQVEIGQKHIGDINAILCMNGVMLIDTALRYY